MNPFASGNRLLALVTFALAIACGLSVSGPVRSASGLIERCTTSDGASVYTDRPCALFGARPAPLSGALVARIASEARHADADAGNDGMAASLDEIAPSEASVGRRSAASGCARTPQQLADDLRGALALGDVNRLAESYHWVGMSYRQGERTLDRLAHLLGRQAVDSRYYAAQIASLSDDGQSDGGGRGGDGGILQVVLAGRGPPSVVEFDVRRYAGCYFVSFPSAVTTIA